MNTRVAERRSTSFGPPASVRFSEVMTGTIRFRQSQRGASARLGLHLTVTVDDIGQFLADAEHEAALSGFVDCTALGGRLPLERGTCRFFPVSQRGRGSGLCYWIAFRNDAGNPLTLSGVKHLRAGSPLHVWADTTTLSVRLESGHSEPAAESLAEGVVHIHPLPFLKQLTTFRAGGESAAIRARALVGYLVFFARGLWRGYMEPGGRRGA
jgi:hypothetical protein